MDSRYAHVRAATNYKDACIQIQKCGYAKDPSYANKLIQVIETNKLYKFDNVQFTTTSVSTLNKNILMIQQLCCSLGQKIICDGIGPQTKAAVAKSPVIKVRTKSGNIFI